MKNYDRLLNEIKIARRILNVDQYQKYCELTEWKTDEEVEQSADDLLSEEWSKERLEAVNIVHDKNFKKWKALKKISKRSV